MRRFTLGVLALLLMLLVFGGVAYTHYASHGYIYSPLIFRRKDPVNLTFYGQAPYPITVRRIEQGLRWPNTRGGIMYFQDHGKLGRMDGQRSSNCARCDRYHIRLHEGADAAPRWGTYTQGSVHYEEWREYCHVVLSFDAAREHVATGLAPGEVPARSFDNNVLPSIQCDGTQPRGDGSTFWLQLP